MKKFIKTLTIVAFVLTVLGAGIMLTSYFIFYSDNIPSEIESSHKVLVNGDVIGLDINSSYYNVSVEKGDEFYVLLEGNYSLKSEVVIEDGILKITGGYCDDIEVMGFNMSPASKIFNPCDGKVTVYVPEDTYLQLIYAEIGCGAFRMKDIPCARLVAQVGIGNISLDNVDVAYDRFLECKLGTVYNNGDMNLAINHADSSSEI
ncbi:MAG: DUF4097 family beta strand repeat-containing protein [Lachnospiraceae bacterium]|nr:DUF4097 family beta strand repeat-containing protein [Lachnospiraceae bacterium]